MRPIRPGVYLILNMINSKCYVGSGVNAYWRIAQHKKRLKRGGHTRHLQNAWNRYGEHLFSFAVIEHCRVEKLLKREQLWINYFRSADERFGYNIAPIAGSILGIKRPLETRKKMSEANRRRGGHSAETRRKIGDANRNPSQETRRKMSEAAKKRPPPSKETRDKISKTSRNRRHSKETCCKISRLKLKQSKATRLKISIAQKRRWEIHRERILANKCKRRFSIEARHRISLGQKRRYAIRRARKIFKTLQAGIK